jgi:D-alanyl-D-alanine endopeptidase (penicillin-binding protein 7)
LNFRKGTQAFDLACLFASDYTDRSALDEDLVISMNLAGMKRLIAGVLGLAMLAMPLVASHAAEQKRKPQQAAKQKAVKPAFAAAKLKRKAPHATTTAKSGARSRQLARSVALRPAARAVVLAAPSLGHATGLQRTSDELDLKSSVAFVIDQNTNEVLLNKNANAVLPIASITKLMTALVVTEKALPLDEPVVVTQADLDATAGNRSRLALGTQLTRGEMLHLALMSSENRAARVLGRSYPGGIEPFIAAMNAKARELGMRDTHYVEPTGLSSDNRSSAQDLSRLVRAAFVHPIIRELSTSPEATVPVGRHQVQFHNTNGLIRNPEWEIGLQKTGYISAAGRCLVMQTKMAGRNLILVLLDSAGKYSRFGDAERIRHWLATAPLIPAAQAASVQPR